LGALKQAPGVIIRRKIIQPMALLMARCTTWYAVAGITVAESDPPTQEAEIDENN
jgi:hypothetical protein